jgi:hypothetical protein
VVPTGYQICERTTVAPQTSMWSEDRPVPADPEVVEQTKALVRTEEWPYAKAVTMLPRPTPQVPALPGMTPLGLPAGVVVDDQGAKVEIAKISGDTLAAAAAAALPKASPQAALKTDYGLALTSALATAKVWLTKGLALSDRAGVWVHFDAVHESNVPHGLSKGQMPASTGNARKRGLIDVAWSDEVGLGKPRKLAVRLTGTGLEAHKLWVYSRSVGGV